MTSSYSEEDFERCTLSGRREILFQLRNLIRQNVRISVTFDEGRHSFLTVLIDVSESVDVLYFDVGGSEETNRAFMKAERCVFSAVVEGIRLQFSAGKVTTTRLAGESVFAVAVPKTMLRLQRREAFRLQLSSAKPYTCRVRRGSTQEKLLPINDISVSGLGIQVADALAYEPMEILENCWIDLRESGMITVQLEVRHIMARESRTGKTLWHMGCRFMNLAPANETQIQRFMARIEVERRALLAE